MTSTRNKTAGGQVLIISLMVTLVILICAVVIFNLFVLYRGVMKTETAALSGALTAAEWQRESLNLIGEINLIKASRSLLDLDIPEIPEDKSPDDPVCTVSPRVRTLTEMQSRIAFIGPLIAYAAAQQAAKQNGLRHDEGDWNINADFTSYVEQLENNERYLQQPDVINYYRWKQPYTEMIRSLANGTLTVRPNGRTPGLNSVNPAWLTDESLYDAIHGGQWCHATLNYLLKSGYRSLNGRWWKDIDYQANSFPKQSEIYPLNVQFRSLAPTGSGFARLRAALVAAGGEREYWTEKSPELGAIHWCVYESLWGNIDTATGHWVGGERLRADIKPFFLYNGALAYAGTRLDTEHLRMQSQNILKREAGRGNEFRVYRQRNTKTAVAQTVGKFESGDAPTAVPPVLPVFGQPARITSHLKYFTIFRINFPPLIKFLMQLSQLSELDDPDDQIDIAYEYFLTALQLLSDPAWRKKGYNPEYTGDLSEFSPQVLFGSSYGYPSSPGGPGWLQQAYVGTVTNAPDEAKNGIWHDEANRRYYLGNQYLQYTEDGKFQTNEEVVCGYGDGKGKPLQGGFGTGVGGEGTGSSGAPQGLEGEWYDM